MDKNKLKTFASECQLAADELSYRLMKAQRLSELQSLCDFNVFWWHDVCVLNVRENPVDFFLKHKDKFKRKMTLREFVKYEMIIQFNNPKDFDEFKNMIK